MSVSVYTMSNTCTSVQESRTADPKRAVKEVEKLQHLDWQSAFCMSTDPVFPPHMQLACIAYFGYLPDLRSSLTFKTLSRRFLAFFQRSSLFTSHGRKVKLPLVRFVFSTLGDDRVSSQHVSGSGFAQMFAHPAGTLA